MFRDRASSLSCLALLVAVVVTALPSSVRAQTMAADRFVEAVGINIHLHYDIALYRRNFPLIKSRLLELGVRHVRDGLIDTTWQGYYDRHNELGDAGIKGTYITAPEQSTDLWVTYPTRISRSFEAFEAPNEYDKSHGNDPNWSQTLSDTVKRLRGLRDVASLKTFPLYGPSLTSAAAYARLGDVSAYADYNNVHHYLSGRHPETNGWGANGYGSLTWILGLSRQYGGGKPTVTTETGYQDVPSALDPVPQEVAGRYWPRLLLEYARAGVVRTFIYELCDFPRSGGYGLLNEDGSAKPAFHAVKNLLTLLADPGPEFTPPELTYSLIGNTDDVHHMVFRKRDGRYYVALWLAEPSWDPVSRRGMTTASQRVTIDFGRPMRVLGTHRWQTDGSVSVTAGSTASTVGVTVTDALVIVEATRGSGVLGPVGGR